MKKIMIILIFCLLSFTVVAQSFRATLQEGQIIQTKIGNTLHTVQVVDVADEFCGIKVDNDVVWLKEKVPRTTNLVYLNVREIIQVRNVFRDRDVCEILIGGQLVIPANVTEEEIFRETLKIVEEEIPQNVTSPSQPSPDKTEDITEDLPEPKLSFWQKFITFFKSLF